MRLIQKAWSKDTCYPPLRDKYENGIPELGQCAVTALLVQDLIGGEIVKNNKLHHYYNLLYSRDGAEVIDLTIDQFSEEQIEGMLIDEIINRENLLSNPDTAIRYRLLKQRLGDLINQENSNNYIK